MNAKDAGWELRGSVSRFLDISKLKQNGGKCLNSPSNGEKSRFRQVH